MDGWRDKRSEYFTNLSSVMVIGVAANLSRRHHHYLHVGLAPVGSSHMDGGKTEEEGMEGESRFLWRMRGLAARPPALSAGRRIIYSGRWIHHMELGVKVVKGTCVCVFVRRMKCGWRREVRNDRCTWRRSALPMLGNYVYARTKVVVVVGAKPWDRCEQSMPWI